jgi:hypothetical protein
MRKTTLKKANAARLAYHLEHLGAAWCRETGLHPAATELVESIDVDGATRYRYAAVGLHPDNLHPDMRALYQAAIDAAATGDVTNLRATVELLQKHV